MIALMLINLSIARLSRPSPKDAMSKKRKLPKWACYPKAAPRTWDGLPRDVTCVTCGRSVRLFPGTAMLKKCPYCGERG